MQATRAFRWAGDKLAIGAGGSFGASSNKGAGEINSFNGAGPATLSLSIVTSPLFSSGEDREIDNTPQAHRRNRSPATYSLNESASNLPGSTRNKHRPSRQSRSRLRACIFVLTRFR